RRITAGSLGYHLVQRLLGARRVTCLGEFERSVELVGRARRVGLLPPRPALVHGDHEHDGDGAADHIWPEALPQRRHAVAAEFLVDFAEKGIVGHLWPER